MIEVRSIQRAQYLIFLRLITCFKILSRNRIKRKRGYLQCLLYVHYYYQLHHYLSFLFMPPEAKEYI